MFQFFHAISNHVDKTIAEPVLCALSISTVQLTENVARAVLISTFLLSCLSFFGGSLNEPGMVCHLQFW